MDDNNFYGNVSTIALFVYLIIAPNLQSLGITQTMFSEFVVAVVGIALAVWSACNPNTMRIFGNHKEEQVEDSDGDEGC